jgi:hypothetical protein
MPCIQELMKEMVLNTGQLLLPHVWNVARNFFVGKRNKVAYGFFLPDCPETDQMSMITKLLKVSLTSNPPIEEN